MSNLIALQFSDPADAFEMRSALFRLQSQYLIEMEDAVVVTRAQDGKVKLHQATDLMSTGIARGTLWGSLIGLLFLNPLLGAAIGASSGALSGAFMDIGISDQFMKDLAAAFAPGTAALFILVRRSTPDKVLEGLQLFAGKAKVFHTSLTKDKEEELRKVFEGASAAAGPDAPQAEPGQK